MSTYLELQDFALGDDFGSARRDQAKLFINQAYGRLFRALRLPTGDKRAIASTVVGTNVYSLPDDFVAFADDDAVFIGTDVLEPVDISDMDQTAAISGQPRAFALSEDLVLFYPNPDAVYTVYMRYRAMPTLTADADVPALPADKHLHLGWYARAKLYLFAGDDPDMHNAIIGTLPRELQSDHLGRDQLRVPAIRRTPGTWSRLPSAPAFHHPDGLW